ncbi:MAG: hypothetical protein KJO29_00460 [Bacteroidia bacterium]|nr:hypothetical protein [Bacteroidia bacterium]
MIGDHIETRPEYLDLASDVIKIYPFPVGINPRHVISISGESGCGKSTLAFSLHTMLSRYGIPSYIFHMDDYFLFPPRTNHETRMSGIHNVGIHEVRLSLLDSHLTHAKFSDEVFSKPLVHYKENTILEEFVSAKKYRVIIVEGTYTSLLKSVDTRLFIDRTYLQTRQARNERARDILSAFNESVLAIEHQIISRHKALADVVINDQKEVYLNK